ncbi:MAG TPA: uracil-DNA glycosylase [Acidobacteriota bacterium]|nr:uracil-DNA glycosylase [Acidobacteriota bacterium]
MSTTGNSGKKIACYRCRFYQVTWDPRHPYGCLAHEFKTHLNPSLVVFETSGIECQLFKPKKTPVRK